MYISLVNFDGIAAETLRKFEFFDTSLEKIWFGLLVMNNLDTLAFKNLFKDAYLKCFGYSMKTPLSESESNLFSNEIFEKTGLTIGWRSLKNYSYYLLDISTGKKENPSIATLDTLARYVKNAPVIDEIQRKNNENHYPYWYQYKDGIFRSSKKTFPKKYLISGIIVVAGLLIFMLLFYLFYHLRVAKFEQFTDNFHSVREDSLKTRGWIIQSKDEEYWKRRRERPGYLALFTLKGDSWADSIGNKGIKNLLLREIPADCFTAEIHLTDFIPKRNWEQAGILLLEDTTFAGKSVRLSLAYNDYAGGFPNKSRDIIIQVVTFQGNGLMKPEEIAHRQIFVIDKDPERLIKENLENSGLRIEKQGKIFRFLFSNGPMKNSAFKEIISREINIQPKYIGIFAIKGFVDDHEVIPAYFNFFSLVNNSCDK